MRIVPLALAGIAALAVPAIAQRSMPTAPVKVDPAVAKARDAALKDDVAYDIVEGLTTEVGQRLAATEAEARARAWAVVKLKALGFKNVHVETYTMPVWVRGEETGEIVGPYPQKLTLTALGRSGATPAGGITAPVVYFPTFNDLLAAPDGSLTGKIAFVSNQMKASQDGSGYGAFGAARFVGPNVAAKKGAAAIVIRSIGSDKGRWPHTGGTNFAPGVTPIPAAALSVADAEQLERIFKRTDKVTMKLVLTPKTLPDAESGNVVGEVPGTDPKAGTIVVGGHLDSWDLGTGAIDDGAGVAITTAAAKRLLDGPRPRRTIRVVWFGAEEPGGFGGEAYAKAHAAEKFAMAAESDFGADNIWKFSVNFPDSAKAIGDRLGVALAPLGIVRGREVAGDGTDVGPLFALGASAVDLNQNGMRYFDWHHTPEDTLDKIDLEQLRQNVAAWTAMLWIVANAPGGLGQGNAKRQLMAPGRIGVDRVFLSTMTPSEANQEYDMNKLAFVLAAASLMSLAACNKPAPTTENSANAMESDLLNNAAAMQNEADASANAAAANATSSATTTYSKKTDSIRAEAEAARNSH